VSISPIPQNTVLAGNGGFITFPWLRWLDELVHGHVGDAATLDGQLPAYYALAAHLHTGVYAAAGAFVDEPWDGGHFDWQVAAGNQITMAYTINGTVLHMTWQIDASTTTAGAASLTMRIPGLYASALAVSGFHTYSTAAGGWDIGPVETAVGSGNVTLYTRTRAAWPAEAGTIYTRGQLTLEIA
jgi:hypothetical protein